MGRLSNRASQELGINGIYTIDEELAREVKDIQIENPIPRNVMEEYR